MERLRIGVIGLGWFGEIHCETIVGVPNVELAALCTRTPERLDAMAAKFGVSKTYRDYHELLADPEIDAVTIVTMWDQHTAPAVAALEAGKHVFLEKPMASTLRRLPRDRRGGEGGGRHPARRPHLPLQPALPHGQAGDRGGQDRPDRLAQLAPQHPRRVDAGDPQQDRPDRRRRVHDTDLMLWFTGERVVSAYAQTVDVRGLVNPDIGQTMYRFDSGATATLETVWCMPERTPFDIDERMKIIGTEGSLHIQDTFPNLGIVSPDGFHSPDTTYWPEFDGVRGGALREEFTYFASCALSGAQPRIGRPEDAMEALAATLAAEESARTGEVVRL